MNFEKLDTDELLRLVLDAMNNGRDAEAMVMLKTLLEREPDHAMARYLLAAQHAQLGMMDRAEAGFREVVERAPDFPIARFQLGQLLLTRGEADEAVRVLSPLVARDDAVGAFSRGLSAAGRDDIAGAMGELSAGLQLPQDNPALTGDMRQLLERLQQVGPAVQPDEPSEPLRAGASPIFMTGYGQNVDRGD